MTLWIFTHMVDYISKNLFIGYIIFYHMYVP